MNESWKYKSNSILKGWRLKTESDDAGFGTMSVDSLEDADDAMALMSLRANYQWPPGQLNLNQQEEKHAGQKDARTS